MSDTTTHQEAAESGLLQPRLVHPRMETPRNEELGMHLDAIHDHCDDAIHKGYCNRNGKKLDAALAHIIASAEAARKLLRMNAKGMARGAPESPLVLRSGIGTSSTGSAND